MYWYSLGVLRYKIGHAKVQPKLMQFLSTDVYKVQLYQLRDLSILLIRSRRFLIVEVASTRGRGRLSASQVSSW
jgi:hypothetical protein